MRYQPPPRREILGRLAFSFLIVAFALFWMSRDTTGPTRRWQQAGAVVCLVLGAIGLARRHAGESNEP